MKKEYQYLIGGALISAAVLLGMGVVGEDKQITEGRYQFFEGGGRTTSNVQFGLWSDPVNVSGNPIKRNMFMVIDTETGSVSYVDISGQATLLPFAATKAEQSNGS